MDKNFKFDISNKAFVIGSITLNPKTKQEDIGLFGYDHYNDYQDKYSYTLKQRLVFKNQDFNVTVVFKGDNIWLVEMKYEPGSIADNTLIKELYQEIIRTDLTWIKNVDLTENNLLRIEF